jgi:hypothetical protein
MSLGQKKRAGGLSLNCLKGTVLRRGFNHWRGGFENSRVTRGGAAGFRTASAAGMIKNFSRWRGGAARGKKAYTTADWLYRPRTGRNNLNFFSRGRLARDAAEFFRRQCQTNGRETRRMIQSQAQRRF